jgi:hypothetical protein
MAQIEHSLRVASVRTLGNLGLVERWVKQESESEMRMNVLNGFVLPANVGESCDFYVTWMLQAWSIVVIIHV